MYEVTWLRLNIRLAKKDGSSLQNMVFGREVKIITEIPSLVSLRILGATLRFSDSHYGISLDIGRNGEYQYVLECYWAYKPDVEENENDKNAFEVDDFNKFQSQMEVDGWTREE